VDHTVIAQYYDQSTTTPAPSSITSAMRASLVAATPAGKALVVKHQHPHITHNNNNNNNNNDQQHTTAVSGGARRCKRRRRQCSRRRRAATVASTRARCAIRPTTSIATRLVNAPFSTRPPRFASVARLIACVACCSRTTIVY
jgi:hypothetical protein